MKQLPLYFKHPNKADPQPACIEFSLRGGPIKASCLAGVTKNVAFTVWYGDIIRISVSPFVTENGLYLFLNNPSVSNLVKVVRTNSQIIRDNSRFVVRLNKAAEDAINELAELASQIETVEIWSPEDWLQLSLHEIDGAFFLDGHPILPENVDSIIASIPSEVDGAICYGLEDWLHQVAHRNALILAAKEEI